MVEFYYALLFIVIIVSLVSLPLSFNKRAKKNKRDIYKKKKNCFLCIIFSVLSILIVIGINIFLIYRMVENQPFLYISPIKLVFIDALFGVFIVVNAILCLSSSISMIKKFLI